MELRELEIRTKNGTRKVLTDCSEVFTKKRDGLQFDYVVHLNDDNVYQATEPATGMKFPYTESYTVGNVHTAINTLIRSYGMGNIVKTIQKAKEVQK